MTATMPQSVDLVSAMVEAGANAVSNAAGAPVHVGQVVAVPPADALGSSGTMINRSELTAGANIGTLLTIVPASGLVTAETALDAMKLTDALVMGMVSGIAAAGGPLLQVASPQLVSSASGIDTNGSEAFAFDLVVGARSVTVIWVVEATLGSLLGGSIPVDGSPTEGSSVAPASLPDLGRAGIVDGDRRIGILSDVITRVSVEIARGTVLVRDLVSMSPGSVFELDRKAGDAVDILVNGSMIARGEIIVVGQQLGVRITDICEPVQ